MKPLFSYMLSENCYCEMKLKESYFVWIQTGKQIDSHLFPYVAHFISALSRNFIEDLQEFFFFS